MFDLTASGSIALTSEPGDGALLEQSLSHLSHASPARPDSRNGDESCCRRAGAAGVRLARLRRAIVQDPDAFIAARLDLALNRLADEFADQADAFR